MVSRDEIARLCAEHDQMMTAHDQWLARREAASGAPVQKSDEPGILYRVTDNNALQAAAEPDGEASDEAYPPLSELHEAIAEFVVEWCNKKLAPCDERLTRLEAKVDALLTLMGQQKPKLWTPDGT